MITREASWSSIVTGHDVTQTLYLYSMSGGVTDVDFRVCYYQIEYWIMCTEWEQENVQD